MKKITSPLILFILYIGILVGPPVTFASQQHMLGVLARKNVAGGSCPSGTYEAGYNGDYGTGKEDYICYEDGSANEQATGNTADSVSSSYVQFDAADEYLEFTITGDISADIDSLGSIFFTFRKVDGGDTTFDDGALVELAYSATEIIKIFTDDTNSRVLAYHLGGAQNQSVVQTGQSISTDTRCGYSCDVGNNIHSLECVTSGSVTWTSEDEDSETLEGFDDSGAVDPSTFAIGEHYSGASFTGDDDVRVWDVYIVAGYQATDPGSL